MSGYLVDYGAAAAAYVVAFMENIDWAKVSSLYKEQVG